MNIRFCNYEEVLYKLRDLLTCGLTNIFRRYFHGFVVISEASSVQHEGMFVHWARILLARNLLSLG